MDQGGLRRVLSAVVVTYRGAAMASIGVKKAKAGLSGLGDDAASGEFVTTRNGEPKAVPVSVEATEAARCIVAMDDLRLVADLILFLTGVDLDDAVFAHPIR